MVLNGFVGKSSCGDWLHNEYHTTERLHPCEQLKRFQDMHIINPYVEIFGSFSCFELSFESTYGIKTVGYLACCSLL
jgi:hypothetical protein